MRVPLPAIMGMLARAGGAWPAGRDAVAVARHVAAAGLTTAVADLAGGQGRGTTHRQAAGQQPAPTHIRHPGSPFPWVLASTAG